MLTTGIAAAENAGIPVGGSVAVFAQGPVDLCATIGARLIGAGLTVAVESKPDRQKLTKQLGADVIVDPSAGTAVEQIIGNDGWDRGRFCNRGFGTSGYLRQLHKSDEAGGVISNVGFHGEAENSLQIPLPEFGLGMGDKKIHGDVPG